MFVPNSIAYYAVNTDMVHLTVCILNVKYARKNTIPIIVLIIDVYCVMVSTLLIIAQHLLNIVKGGVPLLINLGCNLVNYVLAQHVMVS